MGAVPICAPASAGAGGTAGPRASGGGAPFFWTVFLLLAGRGGASSAGAGCSAARLGPVRDTGQRRRTTSDFLCLRRLHSKIKKALQLIPKLEDDETAGIRARCVKELTETHT